MIKKPWQIWTLFALTLGVVVPAMVWLTFQIDQADRLREVDRQETELARREAELQERINSALYRMDWWATPLVAQEAARPYYLYEPFYRVSNVTPVDAQIPPVPKLPPSLLSAESKGRDEAEKPSPLLFGTSEFVVMHFQIDEENKVTSPQRPVGQGEYNAMYYCNVPEDTIKGNDDNLALACSMCEYESVYSLCPDADAIAKLGAEALEKSLGSTPFQTVYNDPNFDKYSNRFGGLDQRLQQAQIDNKSDLNNNPGNKLAVQQNRGRERGTNEYAIRANSADTNVREQVKNQIASNPFNPGGLDTPENRLVREGVMRPIWLGDQLILVRRVEGKEKKLVQCCWLDWKQIQDALRQEIADILPEAEFEPVTETGNLDFARAMATLPVQLVVNSEKLMSTLALNSNASFSSGPSALRWSMILAWIGLGVAVLASALLLRGVMKLSERRAAFVSAVTHELRTPLTTFMMYSEMLAEDMVPAEKQNEYAHTMKREAHRLSNLVENVLQFARLERDAGNDRFETLSIEDLVGRFEARLHQRAEEAGMELTIDLSGLEKEMLVADPSRIEQIVFNLLDNACKYAAKGDENRIEFSVEKKAKRFLFAVQDYGPGVSPTFRKRLFQAFCKSDQEAADTAKGVGLGLALCQRMAKAMGGKVALADSKVGARFVLELPSRQS